MENEQKIKIEMTVNQAKRFMFAMMEDTGNDVTLREAHSDLLQEFKFLVNQAVAAANEENEKPNKGKKNV